MLLGSHTNITFSKKNKKKILNKEVQKLTCMNITSFRDQLLIATHTTRKNYIGSGELENTQNE